MTAGGAPAVERAAAVLGPQARRDAPLGPLTTYRVGGPAALLVEIGAEADLATVGRALEESGLPLLVVGKGSNLLVADAGFGGIALVLGPAFEWVDTGEPGPQEGATVEVRAGGATPLPVLARRTAGAGLRGLEWAVGVPGSVGGGVRMNAGGHGSDVAASLRQARVADLAAAGRVGWLDAGALGLGYRRSSLGDTQVVVAAAFSVVAGDQAAAEAEIAGIVRWRREHQPGGPNAGSVFTNPPGDAAGRLIDAAGLKGLRHGSAVVSPKHANFIQVDPGGAAGDVVALMAEVRDRVHRASGVLLHPEVRLVGFPDGLFGPEVLSSTGG